MASRIICEANASLSAGRQTRLQLANSLINYASPCGFAGEILYSASTAVKFCGCAAQKSCPAGVLMESASEPNSNIQHSRSGQGGLAEGG